MSRVKKLKIGYSKATNQPVFLDTEKLINGNGIVFGASGVGKTHTLRSYAVGFSSIHPENKSIIFDVHGDILENDPRVSSVVVNEQSLVGLQPFIINPDLNYGGINRAIKRFIYAIDSTTSKLGPKQRDALRNLLIDLYRIRGFYQEDPRTWSLDYDPRGYNSKYEKRYPTFDDLIAFARRKQEELYIGADSNVVRSFVDFAKKSRILRQKIAKNKFENESDLEAEKEKVIEVFSEFIHRDGDRLTERIIQDQLKYSSQEVIGGILSRLEELRFSGIFKNEKIMFDESKRIHRYNISHLGVEDQRTFINLVLSDIFLELKERGFGHRTDTFIFLDEAKNYIDDSDGNMVNKFFLEVRKFGCGLWLGAQNIKHFSDDIVTNAGTKIILGVDSTHAKSFAQRLSMDVAVIKRIIPKKTFLIEKKEDGVPSKFEEIYK